MELAYSKSKSLGWVVVSIMLGGFIIGFGLGGWMFRTNLANKTGPANETSLATTLQPPVNIGGAPAVGSPTRVSAKQTSLATTLQSPANVGGALTVGSLTPDFILKTLDGSKVSLSQYRGQPVLINFWASWCPPCRLEMPDLVRVYEGNKAKGFVLLGINLTFQDFLPDVQAFVKEFNITFPVLLDETSEVTYSRYQLRALPMSIFVNRSGVIARIHIGAMTGPQVDEFVAEILK